MLLALMKELPNTASESLGWFLEDEGGGWSAGRSGSAWGGHAAEAMGRAMPTGCGAQGCAVRIYESWYLCKKNTSSTNITQIFFSFKRINGP